MRKTVLFVTVAVVLTAAAAIGAWAGSAAPDPGDGFVVAGDDEKGGIGSVPSRGVVRSWDLENMRGVIDSDDVPGGCHVSFVAVAVDGFPGLTQGQQVEFEWTRLDTPEADFAFECVRVWPAGRQPYPRPPGFDARAWTVHPDGSIEELHFTDEPPEPIPIAPRTTGHTTGTVRMWNDEEGWGVIDSEQTPGGCWAHYSNIIGDGFRTVPVGATVVLDWEQVTDQDGHRYRATRIEQKPS